jgi:hypothetical protein
MLNTTGRATAHFLSALAHVAGAVTHGPWGFVRLGREVTSAVQRGLTAEGHRRLHRGTAGPAAPGSLSPGHGAGLRATLKVPRCPRRPSRGSAARMPAALEHSAWFAAYESHLAAPVASTYRRTRKGGCGQGAGGAMGRRTRRVDYEDTRVVDRKVVRLGRTTFYDRARRKLQDGSAEAF